MTTPVYVINSRGEKELFSFRKVYRSARRVGASRKLAEEIAGILEKETLPNAKTSEIFRRVKTILGKELPSAALKFSLKEGIRKLGPTGFPFERYAGEILSKQGFKLKFNQRISGFCCNNYEIDFVARKGNLAILGECKYHNLAGKRVDLGVALGNHARFLDIKKGSSKGKNYLFGLKLKSFIVTNSKFTSQAINYSECVGVNLLGWKYPQKRGLEYLIDSQKLYPVTVLPSFKSNLRELFMLERMMLARDILERDISALAKRNKNLKRRLDSLVKEAKILLEEK